MNDSAEIPAGKTPHSPARRQSNFLNVPILQTQPSRCWSCSACRGSSVISALLDRTRHPVGNRERHPPSPPKPRPALSMLAAPPDWSALEIYQNTITRAEFERLLTTVFTTGEAWRNLHRNRRRPRPASTPATPPPMEFSTSASPRPDIAPLRAIGAPPPNSRRPLRKSRSPACSIAIDPGHIGGAWAKMEERWFVVGDRPARPARAT